VHRAAALSASGQLAVRATNWVKRMRPGWWYCWEVVKRGQHRLLNLAVL
jgi:hypothetical protein